jgi:hypothetical protein
VGIDCQKGGDNDVRAIALSKECSAKYDRKRYTEGQLTVIIACLLGKHEIEEGSAVQRQEGKRYRRALLQAIEGEIKATCRHCVVHDNCNISSAELTVRTPQ